MSFVDKVVPAVTLVSTHYILLCERGKPTINRKIPIVIAYSVSFITSLRREEVILKKSA